MSKPDDRDIALAALARAVDLESLDDRGFRTLVKAMLVAVGPPRALTPTAEAIVGSWLALWLQSTPLPKPKPASEAATLATVLRGIAKARGEIVELPSDPKARAILAAVAKARNEDPNR